MSKCGKARTNSLIYKECLQINKRNVLSIKLGNGYEPWRVTRDGRDERKVGGKDFNIRWWDPR